MEFELERTSWQRFCAEVWWLVLLQGLAALALGILLLFRTQATVLILVQILGIFFLVDGLFILLKSLRGRRLRSGWNWGVLIGILSILAGMVVLAYPLASAVLTATMLVTFLALAAIAWGLISLLTGLRRHRQEQRDWSLILGGMLSLAIGILLISRPLITAGVLVRLIAIFALLSAFVLLSLAFGLKKACRR